MWECQSEYHRLLVQAKKDGINTSTMNRLIFCQHPHVYTLGKSGKEDHLLLSEKECFDNEIAYYKINRGGDITYHGPGQLVVYPILDLELFQRDVHLYVRNLEEAVIRTLSDWGIIGERLKDFTGVWVKDGLHHLKICAIGVHLSRWVSMHGLALNVSTDLSMFNHIVPCGINDADKGLCSFESLLNEKPDMAVVKLRLMKHFQNIFRYNYK
jgi:lipoyl(octanoyl) transferase